MRICNHVPLSTRERRRQNLFTEFREGHLGECSSLRNKQSGKKQIIRLWINLCVQPVGLVVEPDPSLDYRDVIQVTALCGL
jgi:hypothetical protein